MQKCTVTRGVQQMINDPGLHYELLKELQTLKMAGGHCVEGRGSEATLT